MTPKDPLKTLGPEELAPILRRSVSSVKQDARRRPHTLPPRVKIPGSKQLLWLASDVEEFLMKARVATQHRLR